MRACGDRDLAVLAERFLARETHPHRREKRGKVVELDLRHETVGLSASTNSLEMEIRRGKPLEIAVAVTGLPPETLAAARIEKLAVIFKGSEG